MVVAEGTYTHLIEVPEMIALEAKWGKATHGVWAVSPDDSAFPKDKRDVARHSDIVGNMLGTEKYDVYTEEGSALIDSASDAITKSLGEFEKNAPGRLKKEDLGNVSENIE